MPDRPDQPRAQWTAEPPHDRGADRARVADPMPGAAPDPVARDGTGPAVFLHAGAHRTGTSSFQMCLSRNAARLRQAGFDLAYPGRDGIPGGTLSLRLPAPRHGPVKARRMAAAARAHLAGFVTAPARALILSEENIPGRMLHFYQGRFFPVAQTRAQALAHALPGPVAHLLYVVRPYEALFVSAYRKRAEDNEVPAFDSLRPGLMALKRGWPETVAALAGALQPARITVLDYAQRGPSCALLDRLIGPGIVDGLEEPADRVNLSATDAALEALQARYAGGAVLDRAAWQQVIADHAHQRDTRGFACFPQDERQVLRDRYARDLDRLAQMPGVSLLR